MKKLLTIMLAAVMAVSTFALSALPVMAADDVLSPTASTAVDKKPTLQVNGVTTTTDVTYAVDPENPNVITFTYVGEGNLTGWETNLDSLGLVEGEDYELTENEDGSLTLTLISDAAIEAWKNGEIVVDAIVEFDEDEPTTAGTTKANGSSKSPSTGASTAVVAGTVAAAGAGIAVLAALKKRDAE